MTRRLKVWLAAAVLFSLVNGAGAVMAAVQREPLHAGGHVALLLAGMYVARHIWRRAMGLMSPQLLSNEITDRLIHLEQSVDAVAIEIERVGEGQRFITSLFAENGVPRPDGGGTARESP